MSKEIIYECNLCQETKKPSDLMCLYWKCDIIPQQYVLTSNLEASHKHICDICRDIIINTKSDVK